MSILIIRVTNIEKHQSVFSNTITESGELLEFEVTIEMYSSHVLILLS